jgi:nicotinamidase/pyrazinamidase
MSILSRDADVAGAQVAANACTAGVPVFIEKSRFSVFEGQPQTDVFLRALAERWGGAPEVLICGVATDVCVRQAVEGFLDRGYGVRVVTDATWGLGLRTESELFAEWATRGVRLVTTDELAEVDAR